MKPIQLVSYPGSKLRLLPEINQRLDHSKRVFIEPFLGSGSVMLNIASYEECWGGDTMPYVVRTLQMLAGDEPRFQRAKEWLIKTSQEMPIVPPLEILRRLRKGDPTLDVSLIAPFKKSYYDFRAWWNSARHDTHDDTVLMGFLFLAGGCVNNLVRFGKTGDFNQGWGARTINIGNIDDARVALKGRKVTLYVDSFERLLDDTFHRWGEAFVYLDPPYGGRSEANTNGLYELSSGWTQEDDIKLAEYCKRINAAGGKFLLSNLKENERLIKLMEDFKIEELPGLTYKASVGKHAKRQQTEVLIRN